MECFSPPMLRPPRGAWQCPFCLQNRKPEPPPRRPTYSKIPLAVLPKTTNDRVNRILYLSDKEDLNDNNNSNRIASQPCNRRPSLTSFVTPPNKIAAHTNKFDVPQRSFSMERGRSRYPKDTPPCDISATPIKKRKLSVSSSPLKQNLKTCQGPLPHESRVIGFINEFVNFFIFSFNNYNSCLVNSLN